MAKAKRTVVVKVEADTSELEKTLVAAWQSIREAQKALAMIQDEADHAIARATRTLGGGPSAATRETR